MKLAIENTMRFIPRCSADFNMLNLTKSQGFLLHVKAASNVLVSIHLINPQREMSRLILKDPLTTLTDGLLMKKGSFSVTSTHTKSTSKVVHAT